MVPTVHDHVDGLLYAVPSLTGAYLEAKLYASSAQRALSTLSSLPATAKKVQYTKQELKTLR